MGVIYKCSIRPGYQVKSSADQINSVLSPMAASGTLTAKNLVDVSRPADAPLHKEFVWDDSKAAELYREEQARYVISAVCITAINESGEQSPPTRAYVVVPPEPEEDDGHANTYTHINVVLQSSSMTDRYLNDALKQLEAFRRKYASIKQFSNVISAIDQLLMERDGASCRPDKHAEPSPREQAAAV